MQQRQLRLGDILDDYCPRERRLTNHAVVAMINADVKRTRCTTCDAEHEYRHAKVPRQRRKPEPAALYSQVLATAAPKKVVIETPLYEATPDEGRQEEVAVAVPPAPVVEPTVEPGNVALPREEGPVHRPLIRAQLPRHEGQPPPTRPAPEFTIRQPGGGRPGRFRPRHQRSATGGQTFQGSRSSGHANGNLRGGAPRQPNGRPTLTSRPPRHQGPDRKRSK